MSRTKITIFFIFFLIMMAFESVAQTLKDELESKKRSKEIEQMLKEDKEKLEKSEISRLRAALAKNGYQIKCYGEISEPSASFQAKIQQDTEKMMISSLFSRLVISGNDLYGEKRYYDVLERIDKSSVEKFGSVDINTKYITFKKPENAQYFNNGAAVSTADYPEWQFEFTTGDLYIKKAGYNGQIFLLTGCKKIAWID